MRCRRPGYGRPAALLSCCLLRQLAWHHAISQRPLVLALLDAGGRHGGGRRGRRGGGGASRDGGPRAPSASVSCCRCHAGDLAAGCSHPHTLSASCSLRGLPARCWPVIRLRSHRLHALTRAPWGGGGGELPLTAALPGSPAAWLSLTRRCPAACLPACLQGLLRKGLAATRALEPARYLLQHERGGGERPRPAPVCPGVCQLGRQPASALGLLASTAACHDLAR